MPTFLLLKWLNFHKEFIVLLVYELHLTVWYEAENKKEEEIKHFSRSAHLWIM